METKLLSLVPTLEPGTEEFWAFSPKLRVNTYKGSFKELYQDLVSWSKGEIEIDLGLTIEDSGYYLIIPESSSSIKDYFSLVTHNQETYLCSKAIFEVDGDAIYNYLYRDLLSNKEITNIIKRYDLQKAIGKSFKTHFHMGMTCPVFLVKEGRLESVSFGGKHGCYLDKIHSDYQSGIILGSAIPQYYSATIDSDEYADNFIVLKPNSIQYCKLLIKTEQNNFKLCSITDIDNPRNYHYSHVTGLTALIKPMDVSYILEPYFNSFGFVGTSYYRGPELKGNKGTPIFIDTTKIGITSTILELTEDFGVALTELFGSDESRALIPSDAFFCDKNIFRTEKKTDANRYTKEEYGPFFLLRKNDAAKETSENKSYSNYIRKAFYPLENLVAALVFYTDGKSAFQIPLDKDISAVNYSNSSTSGTLSSVDLTSKKINEVVAFLMAAQHIDTNIIPETFSKIKKYSNMTKYKHGLFDLTFFQDYGRSAEKRFFVAAMERFHTRSSRLFKSERDFYPFSLVRCIYQIQDRSKSTCDVVADFYTSNCTPCVPDLDLLINNPNPSWNIRENAEKASIDISTVFSLTLDNVELLKSVISFNRASEYREFLDKNKNTLQNMINTLNLSISGVSNLTFVLEFLDSWTTTLAESERLFIKDNPFLKGEKE